MDKNKQGIIAAQSGDIKEAQRLFMEAFAETPNNEGLFLNVARSMAMQRKHQELLIYFDHEFTSKGRHLNDPNSAMILAQSAVEMGFQEKAITILESTHERTDNVSIAVMLSEQLLKAGQLEKCQSMLAKTIKTTQQDDPSLITNLAITESELGNYKAAEQLYKRVIEIRPNDFLGYFNISHFMYETGEIVTAKTYLDKAESIVPNTPEAIKLRREIADSEGKENTTIAKIYHLIEFKAWGNAKNLLLEYRKEADQNKWMAAACELPKEQQVQLGVETECSPNLIVRQAKLLDEGDSMISRLINLVKNNASLAWNRAGKPTTGGYQTHEIFKNMDDNTINELIVMIKSQIGSINQPSIESHGVEISGWGVILKSGGFQKKHTHTESLASGVLYLKVPKLEHDYSGADGNIRFKGGETLTIAPYPGLMLLFPSYLPHETIPFTSNDERICIAFNIVT